MGRTTTLLIKNVAIRLDPKPVAGVVFAATLLGSAPSRAEMSAEELAKLAQTRSAT
jgi:hypothetical protein